MCSKDDNMTWNAATLKAVTRSILVVAADSPRQLRSIADYVCDGVNDEVEIVEASNALVTTNLFTRTGDSIPGELNYYPCAFYCADDSKYYLFYKDKRYDSTDGKTWGNAQTLTGWSNYSVARVWKEGATTWKALHRGFNDGIFYSTSSNGIAWTVQNGGTAVLTMSAAGATTSWDALASELDPCGLIKVSSTYYLFYNTVGVFPRRTAIATSTNLTSWTKSTQPLFGDNYFCPDVFVYNSRIYMVICHFTGYHHTASRPAQEEIELWSIAQGDFPGNYRREDWTFHAVVLRSSSDTGTVNIDVPSVITSNIQRTAFPSETMLQMIFYEYGGNEYAEQAFTSLPTASGVRGGTITLAPGRYDLSDTIYVRDGSSVDARGALLVWDTWTVADHGAVVMGNQSRWDGGRIADMGGVASGAGFRTQWTTRALVENVVVQDFETAFLDSGHFNRFRNNRALNATYGYRGSGVGPIVDSCNFEFCSRALFLDVANGRVVNCIAEHCDYIDIGTTACVNTLIDGLTFTAQKKVAGASAIIYVRANCDNLLVKNSTIDIPAGEAGAAAYAKVYEGATNNAFVDVQRTAGKTLDDSGTGTTEVRVIDLA